ncbi:single-stranded DNA-binding protein [Brevibacillus choshinensis]|uniref:single-stranded DNA-binding protein n=1 Tax=Brevibacillus choshinensis TaxID=54911 RepID=UPI002E209614|nr:single-stranded DNA-binding protein [Brevibacillus choshinensis]
MNKTLLIGRLTKDPNMIISNSGVAIVDFTVAVNRQFKNAAGEREADFIRCKAFKERAEMIANNFRQGDEIALEGHIQTGSYEKDGQRVFTTDVIVEQVTFTYGKKKDGAGEQQADPFVNAGKPINISDDDLPF